MSAFVRVVETGSFSAAARDLRVGQPAISKSVAALEERLGARLLIRSTRGLSPTEAGEAFYDHAKRALVEVEAAETAARGLGAGLEGRLRVCAAVTLARLHIVPKLAEFLDAHPKVRVEMILDDRPIDLLADSIDVAYRTGALADSALTARKIAQGARVLVATPDYLARRGVPERPADLLAHDAVIFGQSASGDEWRFRQGGGETSIRPVGRLMFTAAEGVRAAVLAGLGIALGTRWMFFNELARGDVVEVMSDWDLSPLDLWAIYPAGRLPGAKAKAFTEWVRTLLA